MYLYQRINYKLAKIFQKFNIDYTPSKKTLLKYFHETSQAAYFYETVDGILVSTQVLQDRLAQRYIDLADKYAASNKYVCFDPVRLAHNGPWKRIYIEKCLPPAHYIRLKKTSIKLFEDVIHRPHLFSSKDSCITLPEEEIHKLAMLYTDYYSSVSLLASDFCNLNCKMCYYHAGNEQNCTDFSKKYLPNFKKHMIDDHVVYAFLDQIEYNKKIVFSGRGEFFTHKNWRAYFAYAHSHGLRQHVLTNGLLLTKDNFDFCKQQGLEGVICSIDGYDKKSYESIRIGGKFEVIMENLEYMFKQETIHVRINSLMLPELEKKKEVIKDMFLNKAHEISFQTVKKDQYGNTEIPLRKYPHSDLCYQLLEGLILMPDGRYAPCCGICNATFCNDFLWLCDSREMSLLDARTCYAHMLYDNKSPLAQFCAKCNLKCQSYYYNGEHPLEEYVILNQVAAESLGHQG